MLSLIEYERLHSIGVQSIQTPRGTTARPDRCYLLAGLLRCEICGRRLESCWANDRPDRQPSEHDLIDPSNIGLGHRPAALQLLLTRPPDTAPDNVSPDPKEVIDQLRTSKITLPYEPETRPLRTSTPKEVKIAIDHRR